MVSQEITLKILKGETSPSITLYYSDAADHDKALASLPKDIQERIYSGTSKADTTKGMTYISFPLDGHSTEEALQFIDNQKPFHGPLSDNFKQNITAIAEKFKEGAYSDSEEATKAAVKDHDIAAANNILLLQMANFKRPDLTKDVLKNSAEIADMFNQNSPEKLKEMGFTETYIAVYNSVKHLDGNPNTLSAAEAASAHLAELQLVEQGQPVSLNALAPRASAAYTEIYSRAAADVHMDDVCAPAKNIADSKSNSGKCR